MSGIKQCLYGQEHMSGNDAAAGYENCYDILHRQFRTMLNDEEDPVIRHLIQNDDTFSVKTYLFLKKEDFDVQKYEVGLRLLRAVSDSLYQKMVHSMCMCVASHSDREFETQYDREYETQYNDRRTGPAAARIYNPAWRCAMHDERSGSELRGIKTIHERYLRDYSAYMERYLHAPQSTLSQWPRMAAVLMSLPSPQPGANACGSGGVSKRAGPEQEKCLC